MDYLYITIILFCITEIVVLILHRFHVYPINFVLFQLFCYVLGNYYLGDNGAWGRYLIAYMLFFGGYCLKFCFKGQKHTNIEKDTCYANKITFNSTALFMVIISFASYYHIIKVGIPLFSNNIEVDRFNFTGSGFFGIPGRIYLFGFMFLIPYLYYYYNYNHNKKTKILLNLTWLLYVLISVFGGFKSSISALVIFYVYTRALVGKPISVRKFFSLKYICILLISILFAIGISKIYTSVNVNSTKEAIDYLFTRMFSFGALGGNILLNKVIDFTAKKVIFNDSLYFFYKYFHLKITNFNLLPVSKLVSAYNLHITNVTDDTFIAPYTLGAFPELYFDFGYFSYIFFAGLGYLLSYLCLYRTNTLFKQASVCFSITFLLDSYITKGSLIYCLINFTLMLIIFKFLEFITKDIVFKLFKKSNRRNKQID